MTHKKRLTHEQELEVCEWINTHSLSQIVALLAERDIPFTKKGIAKIVKRHGIDISYRRNPGYGPVDGSVKVEVIDSLCQRSVSETLHAFKGKVSKRTLLAIRSEIPKKEIVYDEYKYKGGTRSEIVRLVAEHGPAQATRILHDRGMNIHFNSVRRIGLEGKAYCPRENRSSVKYNKRFRRRLLRLASTHGISKAVTLLNQEGSDISYGYALVLIREERNRQLWEV